MQIISKIPLQINKSLKSTIRQLIFYILIFDLNSHLYL
nr:MAG TPA: hypothetical protein [Caudoviricetes sp.]